MRSSNGRSPLSLAALLACLAMPVSAGATDITQTASADIPGAIVKKEGDPVTKDELVAEQKSFFGVFKSRSVAPVTGTIETISPITGQVLYREPPIPVEVRAYVRGFVKEIFPREGVVVEAKGAFIQGIFGIGGETHGPIVMGATSPDAILTPASLVHVMLDQDVAAR